MFLFHLIWTLIHTLIFSFTSWASGHSRRWKIWSLEKWVITKIYCNYVKVFLFLFCFWNSIRSLLLVVQENHGMTCTVESTVQLHMTSLLILRSVGQRLLSLMVSKNLKVQMMIRYSSLKEFLKLLGWQKLLTSVRMIQKLGMLRYIRCLLDICFTFQYLPFSVFPSI